MSQFWRVLGHFDLFRTSFCNVTCKRTLVNLPRSHVYKKTWKEDELVQYLRNNVVYECDDYFITSLPQGIGLNTKTKWWNIDTSYISDISLTNLTEKLKLDFESKKCFVALYPGRNASGLTILTKNAKAKKYLKDNFTVCAFDGKLVLTFLGVVLGRPDQIYTEDFAVRTIETENGLSTEIRNISIASKKFKRISYQHEVLCSAKHASLVKVEVSSNLSECVRHILATRCYSPVLGDFWNCRRKQGFMFGVPLVRNENVQSTDPCVLRPELRAQLQLEPDEEKFIPSHLHQYRVNIKLKKNSGLFASVPPPEYFVWTCVTKHFPVYYYKKDRQKESKTMKTQTVNSIRTIHFHRVNFHTVNVVGMDLQYLLQDYSVGSLAQVMILKVTDGLMVTGETNFWRAFSFQQYN